MKLKNLSFLSGIVFALSISVCADELTSPWYNFLPDRISFVNLSADSPTISDIDSILQEHSVNSVESFLGILKAQHPDMFERPVLVHSTLAIQEASYQNPRVLLRSENGKLVIAFNGDPRQLGYNGIEIMEYDEENGRFIFVERSFGIDEVNSDKSHSRGLECQTCHSYPYNDPQMNRPLIAPYPVWPTMYGGSLSISKENREYAEFQNFKAKAMGHPRYKLLNLQVPEDEKDDVEDNPTPRLLEIPNASADFTDVMSVWNTDRIIKLLIQHPRFQETKEKLLEAIDKDRQLSGADEDREKADVELLLSLTEHRDKVFHEQACLFGNTQHRLVPATDGSRSRKFFAYEKPIHTAAVLKEHLGFDLMLQSMNPDRSDPSFSGTVNNFFDVLETAIEHQPLPQVTFNNQIWPSASPLSTKLILEANCESCHRTGNSYGAPVIPFGDMEQIANNFIESPARANHFLQIIQNKDPKHRMPYGMPPLSVDEINVLKKFVKDLKP